MMTEQALKRLRTGDLIRSDVSGFAYVIIHDGPPLVAVRTVTITNPTEWTEVVLPAKETGL